MSGTETPVKLTAAADELGIPRETVRTWTKGPNRRLYPIDKVGGVWIYSLEAIKRIAAESHARPTRRQGK